MILEKCVEEIENDRERLFQINSNIFGLPIDTVEDLYQDTIEHFLRKGHETYNPELKFSSWFQKCYRNKIIDYLRERKMKIKIENAISFDSDKFLDISKNENENYLDYILNYVNNLKPKFRDVIRMFYWNDMKHREIGERLGIPETTVKWRLISAKEKLKLSLLNSPIGEYVRDLKKAA